MGEEEEGGPWVKKLTARGEGRRGSCVVCGSSSSSAHSSSAFALEGNGFNKTEVKSTNIFIMLFKCVHDVGVH